LVVSFELEKARTGIIVVFRLLPAFCAFFVLYTFHAVGETEVTGLAAVIYEF
jgi:hypothetical protein